MVEYGYVLVYDSDVPEEDDPRLRLGESTGHDLIATRSGLALPVPAPDMDYVLVTIETWDHEPEPGDGASDDIHEAHLEIEAPTLSIEAIDGGVTARVWLGNQVQWHVRAYQPQATSSEREWLIRLWPVPDPNPPDPAVLWAQSGGRLPPPALPDPAMASRLRLLGVQPYRGDADEDTSTP